MKCPKYTLLKEKHSEHGNEEVDEGIFRMVLGEAEYSIANEMYTLIPLVEAVAANVFFLVFLSILSLLLSFLQNPLIETNFYTKHTNPFSHPVNEKNLNLLIKSCVRSDLRTFY
jgi:uncharacterized membrane protein YagU involved in acid resistance